MGIVITIANEKGGVGKTSVATTLADGFKRCGYKTLLIDADPQRNSTTTFHGKTEDEYTMLDIFERECSIAQAVQHTDVGDIVPGDRALKNREGYYAAVTDGFYILDERIEEVKALYDIILIDTPPHIGTFTTNALVASDGIIIPTMPQTYSISGVKEIFGTIQSVQKRLNNKLKVYGVLVIAYDGRNNLDREIDDKLNVIKKEIGLDFHIFNTKIRKCQEVQKAQDENKTLFEYSSKCNTALDYVDFIKELMIILGA